MFLSGTESYSGETYFLTGTDEHGQKKVESDHAAKLKHQHI